MRVAVYVTDTVENLRGGAEVMLDELVSYLRRQGDDVKVITSGPLELIKYESDVILSQMSWAHDALMVARSKGRKIVRIMHNNNAQTRQHMTFKADLTICNTEWLRDDLGGDVVLHPIVRRENHATTPGDHITLVNLIPEKGAVLFYQLAALNRDMKFMGVLGGYGRQLSNVPGVEIIGNTPFMREDVWSKTRVLIMPSTYESYGMAAVEAMCSGIPVIATDTPGLRESTMGAAKLMNTRCPHAWNEALAEVLCDWDTWSGRSLERAARLDPDADLKRIRECILSVL